MDLEQDFEARHRVEDAAERAARRIVDGRLDPDCAWVSLPVNRPPYRLWFPRVVNGSGLVVKELTAEQLNSLLLSVRTAVANVIVEELLR